MPCGPAHMSNHCRRSLPVMLSPGSEEDLFVPRRASVECPQCEANVGESDPRGSRLGRGRSHGYNYFVKTWSVNARVDQRVPLLAAIVATYWCGASGTVKRQNQRVVTHTAPRGDNRASEGGDGRAAVISRRVPCDEDHAAAHSRPRIDRCARSPDRPNRRDSRRERIERRRHASWGFENAVISDHLARPHAGTGHVRGIGGIAIPRRDRWHVARSWSSSTRRLPR